MEIGGLIVGLIAGLVVGGLAVFLWRRDGATASRELENTRSEMNAYRQEVTEHYVKTADLVDRLTQDYKSLFEHLNDGAMKQMNPEVLEQKLARRSAAPVVLGVLGREGLPSPQPEAPEQPSAATDVSSTQAESDTASKSAAVSEPAAALDPALVTEATRKQEQHRTPETSDQNVNTDDEGDAVDSGKSSDLEVNPGAVRDNPHFDGPVAKGPEEAVEPSERSEEPRK